MRAYLGVAIFVLAVAFVVLLASGAGSVFAQQGHQHDREAQKEEGAHSGMMQMDKGHQEGMMHKGDAKEVLLKGEVLDLYCFMNHPENGQGPDHAKCAKNCINKGLPVGFLTDGEVYLLLGEEHESAADMVAEFAGIQALITGRVIEHHGVKAIEVTAISKVEPSK